jgi:DNA-binding response OmpR family regulator
MEPTTNTSENTIKKRILVVEDEHPYLHALILKLRHAGYEAEGAFNGAEGLKLIKSQKFDLLFLDLVMPDLNGFTLLEDLKTNNITIPTIIVTNLSQEEDRKRVTSFCVLDFIEKTNHTIADIVSRVAQHLKI